MKCSTLFVVLGAAVAVQANYELITTEVTMLVHKGGGKTKTITKTKTKTHTVTITACGPDTTAVTDTFPIPTDTPTDTFPIPTDTPTDTFPTETFPTETIPTETFPTDVPTDSVPTDPFPTITDSVTDPFPTDSTTATDLGAFTDTLTTTAVDPFGTDTVTVTITSTPGGVDPFADPFAMTTPTDSATTDTAVPTDVFGRRAWSWGRWRN